MKNGWLAITMGLLFLSCTQPKGRGEGNRNGFTGKEGEIKLIVLAPGHFHASLLQKNPLPQVSDSVFVYALSPDDAGLRQYLSAIESLNSRTENPASWKEVIYTGADFVDKMVADKKGNVVVLAGNNRDKTELIHKAVSAGLNVLSDKPMAISQADFALLEDAYAIAETNHVLLYDMMTERYDLLNRVERELIHDPDFFGELIAGTPDQPAAYMESIHHFYKEVSGVPLLRPGWYYDVEQQGEGIADVTTHLIDLLFWKCFPDQAIDYKNDIGEISSTHWPTEISLQQFTKSTGETAFPDYLRKYIDHAVLNVYANGSIHFEVKGHAVEIKVIWNYQAPEGGGDASFSTLNGTKAILKTIQNKDQSFVKQLYVQAAKGVSKKTFEANLQKAIAKIQLSYPYVSYMLTSDQGEYLINIPAEHRTAHESHFKNVAESYFSCLVNRNMPEWEVPNTIAKYYITTKAREIAQSE
ncbi:MAG: putative oxidoreductase C-terminal domain-containing protein [Proteiniphilum sp.]|nr:putative oxidoreductase C-terminal domain-containing protein [Proteiniphilum sp.]